MSWVFFLVTAQISVWWNIWWLRPFFSGYFCAFTSDEDECGFRIRLLVLTEACIRSGIIWCSPFIHCNSQYYGLEVKGNWQIFIHLNFSQKKDQVSLYQLLKYMPGIVLIHRSEYHDYLIYLWTWWKTYLVKTSNTEILLTLLEWTHGQS